MLKRGNWVIVQESRGSLTENEGEDAMRLTERGKAKPRLDS